MLNPASPWWAWPSCIWVPSWNPRIEILAGRRRLCSRLGILATIGFLLLVPLQALNTIRGHEQSLSAQITKIRASENNLKALDRVVVQAGSTEELRDGLKALQGPDLDATVLAMPLSMAKEKTRSMLVPLQRQSTSQREALPPPGPQPWLLDVVRGGGSCLLLALGFSALSHRPGAGLPLLMEQQMKWSVRSQQLPGRPGRLASALMAFKNKLKGGEGPRGPIP